MENFTFIITAVPRSSNYLGAAGLLGLTLWPSRKRLLKDAKKILGLTSADARSPRCEAELGRF